MSNDSDISMVDEEEELKHADDLTLGGLPKLVIVGLAKSLSTLRKASLSNTYDT